MSRNDQINSYPGKGLEPCPTDFGWVPLNVPMDLNLETNTLVRDFAEALALKLYEAQKKYGYSNNWQDSSWMDKCREDLQEHLKKGDPRDVAAYCAFLWYHNESTIKQGNKNETE
jgi:hypothetical protein